jgi:hypothetical protein
MSFRVCGKYSKHEHQDVVFQNIFPQLQVARSKKTVLMASQAVNISEAGFQAN